MGGVSSETAEIDGESPDGDGVRTKMDTHTVNVEWLGKKNEATNSANKIPC